MKKNTTEVAAIDWTAIAANRRKEAFAAAHQFLIDKLAEPVHEDSEAFTKLAELLGEFMPISAENLAAYDPDELRKLLAEAPQTDAWKKDAQWELSCALYHVRHSPFRRDPMRAFADSLLAQWDQLEAQNFSPASPARLDVENWYTKLRHARRLYHGHEEDNFLDKNEYRWRCQIEAHAAGRIGVFESIFNVLNSLLERRLGLLSEAELALTKKLEEDLARLRQQTGVEPESLFVFTPDVSEVAEGGGKPSTVFSTNLYLRPELQEELDRIQVDEKHQDEVRDCMMAVYDGRTDLAAVRAEVEAFERFQNTAQEFVAANIAPSYNVIGGRVSRPDLTTDHNVEW